MRIRSWQTPADLPIDADTLFRGVWEYELQQGEVSETHQHESGEELNIALEGSGRITIGGTTRGFEAGQVVLVPAGVSHRIENPGCPLLRGLTIEAGAPLLAEPPAGGEQRVTAGAIEDVIDAIPGELSESEALQLIIRLFDLAGHLSEQIEDAIGLENDTGFEALQNLERKVMGAVVTICHNYENGQLFRRRF